MAGESALRYAWAALNSHTTSREILIPTTEEDRREVQLELERILASPPFTGSRRYPALLRHVVEKTLRGEVDDLKERILGIEVFQRPNGYDTNADPVVRFSAGEIRRRIAQFYQDISDEGSIEIGLPVGSYIPQFFRIEARDERFAALPEEKTSTFHQALDLEGPSSVAAEMSRNSQHQVGIAVRGVPGEDLCSANGWDGNWNRSSCFRLRGLSDCRRTPPGEDSHHATLGTRPDESEYGAHQRRPYPLGRQSAPRTAGCDS